MKNKKIFLVAFIILMGIIIALFLIFNYKNRENGDNNINKSEEEIINEILNIKSYKAKLDIKIETNKNKTQYVVQQELNEGKAFQKIIEPSNIAGVITEYDGTNLKISNNKLELETTFQNYQYIVENRLWLDSFIEEYKKGINTKIDRTQNEIILKVKRNDNPYNVEKSLYIDINKQKPTKLIIKDINKKMLVYILYTEIEVS